MKKLLLCLLCVWTVSLQAQNHPRDGHYSFGLRITGRGKPMIMIPGQKGSADTYNDVVDHYKAHYKCYVITLAGFAGQPASGELDHPLQKQRDDIIQFIIDQHFHQPILVGFSFGGALALWIASTRPDLIGKLIELDGTPFDTAIDYPNVNMDSVKQAAVKLHAKILSHNDLYWKHVDSVRHTAAYRKQGFEYLKILATDSLRINQILDWDDASDYKAADLMGVDMDALDMRDSVKKINCPILVLGCWRGWDVVKTKEEAGKRYRAEYAPAKNVTVAFSANGKHFLMYEDFDWMIAQMDAFLAKNR